MKIFNKSILVVIGFLATTLAFGQNTATGTSAGNSGGGTNNSSFGAYAGENITSTEGTYIGYYAGKANTSGSYNVFVGAQSGKVNTTGYNNTFFGYQTGYSNSTGFNNLFLGYKAGYNALGDEEGPNHFVGYMAGYSNTIGGANHFAGYRAGTDNTSAWNNTFIGFEAGENNTTGSSNLFIGFRAGSSNTTASNNLYIGTSSGTNSTGTINHFIGYRSGYSNTSGGANHFQGYTAGYSNTTGEQNYFSGPGAGYYNTTGSYNNFSGFSSGNGNTTASYNHFNGNLSGVSNTTGTQNTYIGYAAGGSSITGSYNTFIGYYAGASTTSLSDATAIGYQAQVSVQYGFVLGNSNSLVGIRNNSPAYPLHVGSAYTDGSTWYNSSDKDQKENFAKIKSTESILEKVIQLPIQYWNYKGLAKARHIGPTAQDFYNAFKLGDNEKAIASVDEAGVALAAIQELANKTKELESLVKRQQELIKSLIIASENAAQRNDMGLEVYQNNPNPSRHATQITMRIPQNVQNAELFIYDMQGKPVKNHVISDRGLTTVTVEGGTLNTGMYIYTVVADGTCSAIKRMILTE